MVILYGNQIPQLKKVFRNILAFFILKANPDKVFHVFFAEMIELRGKKFFFCVLS